MPGRYVLPPRSAGSEMEGRAERVAIALRRPLTAGVEVLVFVGSKPVIAPPKVIAVPETIWNSPAAPSTGSATALAGVGKSVVVVTRIMREQNATNNRRNDLFRLFMIRSLSFFDLTS